MLVPCSTHSKEQPCPQVPCLQWHSFVSLPCPNLCPYLHIRNAFCWCQNFTKWVGVNSLLQTNCEGKPSPSTNWPSECVSVLWCFYLGRTVLYLDWAVCVNLDHVLSALFDFGLHGKLFLQGSDSTDHWWCGLFPLTWLWLVVFLLWATCVKITTWQVRLYVSW